MSDLEGVNKTDYFILEMLAVVSVASTAVHLLYGLAACRAGRHPQFGGRAEQRGRLQQRHPPCGQWSDIQGRASDHEQLRERFEQSEICVMLLTLTLSRRLIQPPSL